MIWPVRSMTFWMWSRRLPIALSSIRCRRPRSRRFDWRTCFTKRRWRSARRWICSVNRIRRSSECSVRVNSLENEADRISRDAISLLFEKETDPIAVIKWKEIYENFEAGTDRCEDVANILERIALKHT